MADEGWVAPGTEGTRGPFDTLDTGAYGGAGQPWAGPYGPQPPPPSRGRVRFRVVLGLVAVAALVTVTVVVALVLPSDEGGDADPADPALVEPADVELVPFRDPQGAYQISVPEGWASASLEGDMSDIGQRTFPDDPELAEKFQEVAAAFPRALVFLSIDPDEATVQRVDSNVSIVRVPDTDMVGGDPVLLVAQARHNVTMGGGRVTGDGMFPTAAGQAARVTYDMRNSVAGVQYSVAAGDDVWTLTFTSREMPDEEPAADAVAATFAPSQPGG